MRSQCQPSPRTKGSHELACPRRRRGVNRNAGPHPRRRPRAEPEQDVRLRGHPGPRARRVSADFARGEFTAIMGPSGSGKSTLMHCLAGLDAATSGSVLIGDTELTTLSDKQMTQLRRDRIGFVFQAFNLVPTLTALENITLPLDIAGRKPDPAWLDNVLTRLGLRRPARAPAERAVRRPAAAGRLRAGAGRSAGDHLRRRADRQPRLAVLAARCWPSCGPRWTSSARPSSSSPTIPGRRATPTGWSSSPTARSSTRCVTRPPIRSWTA